MQFWQKKGRKPSLNVKKSPFEVWWFSEDKPRKFSNEISFENTSFWLKLHLLHWGKSERYRIPWCLFFFEVSGKFSFQLMLTPCRQKKSHRCSASGFCSNCLQFITIVLAWNWLFSTDLTRCCHKVHIFLAMEKKANTEIKPNCA